MAEILEASGCVCPDRLQRGPLWGSSGCILAWPLALPLWLSQEEAVSDLKSFHAPRFC